MNAQVKEAVRWVLESVASDDHAKFSPSGAHRWMECPGSMALEIDFENQGSEYADEGTVAHAVLSDCFLNETDANVHSGKIVVVRQKRSDGSVISEREFTVDDEMVEHVQTTLDSVRRRTASKTLLVEQRVEFTQAIGTLDRQFGTSDIIMISLDGEDVDVEDFKYGAGVKVYASDIVGYQDALDAETGAEIQVPIKKGNKQMLSYALGVLETFGGILGDFKRFHLRVHQPRIDGGWEDEFTVSVEDVIEHGAQMRSKSLHAAVAMEAHSYGAKEPDAVAAKDEGQYLEIMATKIPVDLFNPGEKQCRFCRAKSTCPALRQFVAAQVYDDFEVLDDPDKIITSSPQTPSGERLGVMYGHLSLIQDWCKAIKQEAERLVHAGMTVIGSDGQPMKLIQGKKGDRYWKDPEGAEGLLVGLLPPDQVYVKKMVTPAAAETAVCKGLRGAKRKARWEQFTDYVGQEPGKPTIALGSDPRPVYQGESQTEEFENLDAGDPSK